MSTNLRVGKIAEAFLATLLACGVVACTSSEPAGGTGGSGGGGTGGTTTGTLCPIPNQALITDFTYTPSGAVTTSAKDPRFSAGTLVGGGSSYGAGLTSDVTQGNWHISGTVSDYSGFNIYFDNCDILDASKYKGISFTISGTGTTSITMSVGTVADKASAAWLISKSDTSAKATDSGSCTPTSGDNRYYTPGCADPKVAVTLLATAATQTVLWTDLKGGSPLASPAAAAITSISWSFDWAATGVTAYPVDIVIDNLSFIP
jgi:hypothetical protein